MTTTFQKNAALNLAFGNAAGDVMKFSSNIGRVRNQAKLVLEETRELLEAVYFDHDVQLELTMCPRLSKEDSMIDTRDVIRNIIDAQGDITTVNDGVAHILGVNGDEVLQRVYASNMSKFVRSPEEVAPALQYYYELGFKEGDLDIQGEFPRAAIKVVETITVGGKEYPKGKFLKNMATFQEPDFEDLMTSKPLRQTTSIVCSMAVNPDDFKFSGDNSVVVTSPNFFQKVVGECGDGYTQHIQFGDQIESLVPVYRITEKHFPDVPAVWGHWKGNVRHYLAAPTSNMPTELIRLD